MKGLYVFLGIVLLLIFWGGASYNGMNRNRVNVDKNLANVQVNYQRRADLIPNLVETVKGVANFEQKTLTDVIQARASATSIKLDPKDLSAEKLKEFQASQGQLSQALGRLMVVSEQYPQLKANEQYKALMVELAGTEDRIKNARYDYNQSVGDYNVKVTSFPNNILAGMFGFKERTMFEAEADAQKAPKVKF